MSYNLAVFLCSSVLVARVLLLSDISSLHSLVTVEVCILQKQPVREFVSRSTRTGDKANAVLNFVVKDIMGDTANVVFWGSADSARELSLSLPIGQSVRLLSLKVTTSREGSDQYRPTCTCPWTLQVQYTNNHSKVVEDVHPRIAYKLSQSLRTPPALPSAVKSIKELLEEKSEVNVTVIAVVVNIGEPVEAITRYGSVVRLSVELADQTAQSILLTVWGDMALYINDQCLPWDSVIVLQHARLSSSPSLGKQIQLTSRTLITVNVTGQYADELKQLVEMAQLQLFQPVKLLQAERRLSMTQPTSIGPPQWVTLQLLEYLEKTGFFPPSVDPNRLFTTIGLLTHWGDPTVRGRCSQCKSLAPLQYLITKPNPWRCTTCGFDMNRLEVANISISGHFSDKYGGLRLLLQDSHIESLIGSTEGVGPLEIRNRLDGLQWKRFVLTFAVELTESPEGSENAVRLVDISNPTPQQWKFYIDVAM